MSMETCKYCFTVIDTDLDVDHEYECEKKKWEEDHIELTREQLHDILEIGFK